MEEVKVINEELMEKIEKYQRELNDLNWKLGWRWNSENTKEINEFKARKGVCERQLKRLKSKLDIKKDMTLLKSSITRIKKKKVQVALKPPRFTRKLCYVMELKDGNSWKTTTYCPYVHTDNSNGYWGRKTCSLFGKKVLGRKPYRTPECKMVFGFTKNMKGWRLEVPQNFITEYKEQLCECGRIEERIRQEKERILRRKEKKEGKKNG